MDVTAAALGMCVCVWAGGRGEGGRQEMILCFYLRVVLLACGFTEVTQCNICICNIYTLIVWLVTPQSGQSWEELGGVQD